MLLVTIEVDSVTYRGSLRGHAGEYFYSPWVRRMPSLELGPVEDSGRIGVKFGNLSLTNELFNSEHPFGLSRYEDLLQRPQLYPCTLRWEEDGRDLFNGQIFLQTVSEQELAFALTDTEYTLGARPFTLTESFVFVEQVSVPGGGQPVQITANSHNLTTGTVVIFEQMNSIGENLEYSGVAADNYYYINSVISANVFTLQSKEFVPVTSGVGNTGSISVDGETHRVGIPLRVPFTWGLVTHATPVIKKRDDEVCNPALSTVSATYPIEIREDGVLIYSTDSGSSEYWNASGGSGVAPTSTVIKLNSATVGGVLSISGLSTNGTDLEGFFTYVANQLGLTVDLTYG